MEIGEGEEARDFKENNRHHRREIGKGEERRREKEKKGKNARVLSILEQDILTSLKQKTLECSNQTTT